jgi:integrase
MLLGRNGLAASIGGARPARSVAKGDIIPHLASVHRRGAAVRANAIRATAHAAFAFGIRSENSYFEPAGEIRWDLEHNPVSVIPADPSASIPGERVLNEAEFVTFWRWLSAERRTTRIAAAVQMIMATGQRPCEILQLSLSHRAPSENLLNWRKTKNGKPHCIPLPHEARGLLDDLKANPHGRYFWSRTNPLAPAATRAASCLVRRYIKETGAEPFQARDLRRTWKTLAGSAGLSKEIRDRLQNHSEGGVSAKHYDRWSYLPEKRAAVDAWDSWLQRTLQAPENGKSRALSVDEVTLSRLAAHMGARSWRAVPQVPDKATWIGAAVAVAFDIGLADRGRLNSLIAGLAWRGIIERRLERIASRRTSVAVYVWSSANGAS